MDIGHSPSTLRLKLMDALPAEFWADTENTAESSLERVSMAMSVEPSTSLTLTTTRGQF